MRGRLWLRSDVFAFTTTASTSYADIEYRPDDVFMFGPESVGLPAEVQQDPRNERACEDSDEAGPSFAEPG